MVNGPYALIISAVSAELATHPSLRSSSKSMGMVTAIIVGTGSIGAAVGPFITGAIEGLENGLTWTFVMLMSANVCAFLVSFLMIKLISTLSPFLISAIAQSVLQ